MSGDIGKRICPLCAKKVKWATSKRGSGHKVKCTNKVSCKWKGPFYDSIPIYKKREDPEVKEKILKLMGNTLDFQISGTRAISDFEEYTLNHPYADPDPRGNREMEVYFLKVSQIKFLQELLSVSGINDEEYTRKIVMNEINRLFQGGIK